MTRGPGFKRLPDSARRSAYMKECTRPVPDDIWNMSVEIFLAASHFTMPVENPETRIAAVHEGAAYVFTDTALNRGMLAVSDQWGHQQNPTKSATMMRLMLAGQAIQAAHDDPRFAAFFGPDQEGAWALSESLVGAFACARINTATMTFDLSSLLSHAQKRDAAEAASEK